jgi:SAM-dependent methyltransferase
MCNWSEEIRAGVRMKCPSCGIDLGEIPAAPRDSIDCPACKYSMTWQDGYWDACVDKTYPRSFARQWVLWEAGKLGDPRLVYGNDPKKYFQELLRTTSLTENDLRCMKILEVGYGHGRTLRQLQQFCPRAYGLDLAKPLPSAQLRPGSVFFGNLLNMPFAPGQFDLVLCRGVIHHTPNPGASFDCLSAQVAPNGLLYLGGHYEPGIKGSLLLRRLLPGSWFYPEPVLLALAGVFSAFRSVIESVRKRTVSPEAFRQSYAHYKLDLFDVMTPRWSSLHGEREVKGWFTPRGFRVQRLGPGEYIGIKG